MTRTSRRNANRLKPRRYRFRLRVRLLRQVLSSILRVVHPFSVSFFSDHFVQSCCRPRSRSRAANPFPSPSPRSRRSSPPLLQLHVEAEPPIHAKRSRLTTCLPTSPKNGPQGSFPLRSADLLWMRTRTPMSRTVSSKSCASPSSIPIQTRLQCAMLSKSHLATSSMKW